MNTNILNLLIEKEKIKKELDLVNDKLEKERLNILKINENVNIQSNYEVYNVITERGFEYKEIENQYFTIFDFETKNKKICLKCFSKEDISKFSKKIYEFNLDNYINFYNEIVNNFIFREKDIFNHKSIKEVNIPINENYELKFFFFYEFDYEKIQKYIDLLKEYLKQ